MSPQSARAAAPEAVPVLPASTVLLVDDRPDLSVLVLRRRAGSDFVGGMYVFPGGGVDADDGDEAWSDLVIGLDPATAGARLAVDAADHTRLAVDAGALAYWIAAVRETYEEAGVLLGTGPGARDGLTGAGAALRDAVDRGDLPFADAVRRLDVRLDLSVLHPIARWITPVGPTRRYDTRFFVAAMPAGQDASHDGVEAVHLEWVQPGAALARWRAGELVMLPPTVCMLQQLDRYTTTEAVLEAAAAADGPGARARIVGRERGRFAVTLPGEPGHDNGRDTLGWVALA